MEGVYCSSDSGKRQKALIYQDFVMDISTNTKSNTVFYEYFIENYLERSCLSCNFAATRQILFYSLRCWLKAALLTSQLIPAAAQSSAAERYGS